MSYDGTGLSGLDYKICEYQGSRLKFRGPKAELGKPYIAFLGATETFGKFIDVPFPDLLSARLSVQTLNLGLINGGVDAYLGDTSIMSLAAGADLRVVQVLGALNQTNHYFKVHPRRNDRFVAPCEALVRLFPEVDFAEFHFTKAMLIALQACSKTRYRMLCQELQKIWLKRMSRLLDELGGPTILLWFAGAKPPKRSIIDPRDPMLVDAKMLAQLRLKATTYVECVPSAGTIDQDEKDQVNIMASPSAMRQIMGPNAHLQTAHALQDVCVQLLI